jgi:hypothetical protein
MQQNKYRQPATDIATAALERGPFVKRREYYTSGVRLFSAVTVNRLIERGVAVRIGSGVVHRNFVRET